MKIILGCEESQTVCKAFREKGHDAFSCDIIDCSGGHPEWHIKGSVLDHLEDGWDMGIFFPPCTYLTNAGIGYFNIEKYGEKAIERKVKRQEAFYFFKSLYNAPIPKICIENPVGYINTHYKKPTQIIHPYFFGDASLKKTCLWLKSLPPLFHRSENDLFGDRTHTNYPQAIYTHERKPSNYYKGGETKKRYFVDTMKGSHKDRALHRSKTFPGIAEAMASQWG